MIQTFSDRDMGALTDSPPFLEAVTLNNFHIQFHARGSGVLAGGKELFFKYVPRPAQSQAGVK